MSDRGLWILFLAVASAFITVLAAYGAYHLVLDMF